MQKYIICIFIFIVYCWIIYRAGPIKSGSSRLFWGLGPYPAVAVAGLGDSNDEWDVNDEINGIKENVRIAAAGNYNFTR